TFEGDDKGQILEHPTGDGGLGNDPVLQPVGYTQSFAQLTLEEKNKISHRGLAMQKLAVFLLSQIR
ncbi:MAG: non-canonical purine NTP pyrophosphatase, partial [Flavobacteriaceae bacterium]